MACYHNKDSSNKIVHDTSQPAVKLFVRNLQSAYKHNETWQCVAEITKKPVTFRTVWLQGFIETVVDANNFVLKDVTGMANVMTCVCVPGDNSWIKIGSYCSVVGTLIKPGDFPEVATLKLADLSGNPGHQTLWNSEVRELQLLLTQDVKLQA